MLRKNQKILRKEKKVAKNNRESPHHCSIHSAWTKKWWCEMVCGQSNLYANLVLSLNIGTLSKIRNFINNHWFFCTSIFKICFFFILPFLIREFINLSISGQSNSADELSNFFLTFLTWEIGFFLSSSRLFSTFIFNFLSQIRLWKKTSSSLQVELVKGETIKGVFFPNLQEFKILKLWLQEYTFMSNIIFSTGGTKIENAKGFTLLHQ